MMIIEDMLILLKQSVAVKAFGGLSIFFYGLGMVILLLRTEILEWGIFPIVVLWASNFADFLSPVGSGVYYVLGFDLLYSILVLKDEMSWTPCGCNDMHLCIGAAK